MSGRTVSLVAVVGVTVLTLVAILAPTAGLTQTDTTPVDTVTVTAAGKVEGRPDLAAVSFGIRGKADTASAAMNELSAEQNAVIDALRTKAGLTEEQVTTGNVALGRACHYERSLRRTVCEGYLARTSVRAETDDLDVVGDIIDLGVAAGASSVNDVSFERTSEDDAIKEALAQAMDLAIAKAEVLATSAGRQLGQAIVIEEGGAQRPVFSAVGDAAYGVATSGGTSSIVINPADQITKVRIVVTFALN